ncbi:hypothetical protein [Cytobacillus purgationiresistens]|uniref:Transcriptional regulator n=1 Tax=Cytobacillus purgationiresistens TaxID=863449 RepID=A0ABU0AMD0_9BACI|nr:hypothetical protein [Cytobacillus purgationiresistens]MDQ0271205.1 putative transcriptional regulator [Cytobacillus purgationiresistens]
MADEFQYDYADVLLAPDIISIFADIIQDDPDNLIVMKYFIDIHNLYKSSRESAGVTINDLVENIQVDRRVKVKKGKGFTFEKHPTNMSRQQASRIVDRLFSMSLLSYKAKTPYKYYFITVRGAQVIKEVYNRMQLKERN